VECFYSLPLLSHDPTEILLIY